MYILGIETSCDETGVAVVSSKALLAHALYSQVDMHQAYGGVVPELASRDHIQRIVPLAQQVLKDAGLGLEQINAVAYTAGPGLAGALLVGASVAQALAFGLGKPALAIHHLEGHLLSPLLSSPRPNFPFIALLVSGGHTQLMQVQGVGQYTLLGETLDDAAGEAFDKTAKLLGLPYPGGPALASLAEKGDAKKIKLPRPMLNSGNLDFSFSGLKTAVLTRSRALKELAENLAEEEKTTFLAHQYADLAAATQAAIVEVLVSKSLAALASTGLKTLVVAGGVGANLHLRQTLNSALDKLGIQVFYPPLEFCTDNGAMIALAACLRIEAGLIDLNQAEFKAGAFSIKPRWPLTSICTLRT